MYKNIFIDWFENVFSGEMVRDDMVDTVEDSPWHREDNVWVHTEMVVNHYVNMSPNTWDKLDLIGALMCAFHDTGKPMAEEVVTRSDGTEYRRYGNHDTMSGNIFIDYYLKNRDMEVFKVLNETDVYNIWVMIAYHMPYKMKNERLEALKVHMERFELTEVFTRGVFADAKGRFADDQAKTESQSKAWCDRFKALEVKESDRDTSKNVILLEGCSGIGKTTLSNGIIRFYGEDNVAYHSMDQLRLDVYSSDYSEAFRLSTEDSDFGNKVNQDFAKKLKSHSYVLVDNTNLTWKRRNQYLNNSKNAVRIAYVLVADFKTVLDRQAGREDKFIPYHAVERMYYSHRPAIYGEVDQVILKGF